MRDIPYGLFRVSARVAATIFLLTIPDIENIWYMDHLIAERLHSEYLHSCSILDAPSSVVEQQAYKNERE